MLVYHHYTIQPSWLNFPIFVSSKLIEEQVGKNSLTPPPPPEKNTGPNPHEKTERTSKKRRQTLAELANAVLAGLDDSGATK